MQRLPYAAASAILFASQHAIAYSVSYGWGRPPRLDWIFLLMPMRAVAQANASSDLSTILSLVYSLAIGLGWRSSPYAAPPTRAWESGLRRSLSCRCCNSR